MGFVLLWQQCYCVLAWIPLLLTVRCFASRSPEVFFLTILLFLKLLDWFCFLIFLFLCCFQFLLSPSYVLCAVYTNNSVFAFKRTFSFLFFRIFQRMSLLFYIVSVVCVSFSLGERKKWKAVDRLKWLLKTLLVDSQITVLGQVRFKWQISFVQQIWLDVQQFYLALLYFLFTLCMQLNSHCNSELFCFFYFFFLTELPTAWKSQSKAAVSVLHTFS